MQKLSKFFCAVSLLFSSYCYSGGVILYEIGTPDVGLASAGWAARAEDAGTVFTNPAGMTRFCSPELLVGAQPIYLNIDFRPDSETTISGTHGNASEWLPAGGSYLVVPINENISVGAATLGYFGSAIDYGDHWVGRYYLTRSECEGFSFVPGGAYRINDQLSIGACANVMYAINRTHARINNGIDGLPDGRLRTTGSHWGVGGILGVLYEYDPCTRFGVTYVSVVKQKFRVTPKFLSIGPLLTEALDFLGILNGKETVHCNIPNWVMASFYKKFTSDLAVVGNVGWQQWSRFARVEFTLASDNPTTITFKPKYEDTWHGAIGLIYEWDCSRATCGVAYDSSMVSNKNRTPNLPIGQQWRFGLGYQYAWNECIKLNAAYELNWSGDLKMDQSRGPIAGRVAGKFKNVYGMFFTGSLIWDF